MRLVSPICWDHHLLVLSVPLAVVWLELPASLFARAILIVIVAAFWAGYPTVWAAIDLNGRTATPVHSLGVLSYQFYPLCAFPGLILVELRKVDGERPRREQRASAAERMSTEAASG
jgi:hypothetical protein